MQKTSELPLFVEVIAQSAGLFTLKYKELLTLGTIQWALGLIISWVTSDNHTFLVIFLFSFKFTIYVVFFIFTLNIALGKENPWLIEYDDVFRIVCVSLMALFPLFLGAPLLIFPLILAKSLKEKNTIHGFFKPIKWFISVSPANFLNWLAILVITMFLVWLSFAWYGLPGIILFSFLPLAAVKTVKIAKI